MASANYKDILIYLDENREKRFINPENPEISEEDKNKYILMQQRGIEIIDELNKIAKKCRQLGLNHIYVEPWLDSYGTKTRRTLCVNMKYGECADIPISVSICVEKNGSYSRYKVCLDINNDGVNKTILEKFHTHYGIMM